MNIKEFYDRTGGDYKGAMQRLMKESRVEKFARMFLDDPCYNELESNLSQNNVEEAFRAAHTLKGVCMNLSFTRLYESVSAVTEALRHAAADSEADMAKVAAGMEELRSDYKMIIDAIQCLGD